MCPPLRGAVASSLWRNLTEIFFEQVITRLNLASKPFRNRTLPYLLAALLVTLAAIGAVMGLSSIRDLEQRTSLAKMQVTDLDAKLKDLNSKGELVQQQLTPEQRSLLVGAHKLVANKSFGWSRLFADLESVLPGGVSASRIGIENVYRDGTVVKAELEMSVLSRDYRSVLTMIDNMNNSGLFRAELRSQNLKETDRSSFTEFTMRVVYSPRPAAPADGEDSKEVAAR